MQQKFTDDEIERHLIDGDREAELREELGDDAYEALRDEADDITGDAGAQEFFGLFPERQTVYVLPGIMGSKLSAGDDLIWFDPVSMRQGAVAKLAYGPPGDGVRSTGTFWSVYGLLRLRLLAQRYRVVFLHFDWRRPTTELGDALFDQIRADGRTGSAIVAHSMGGLVARQIAARDPDRKLIRTIVTVGTPNGGSYSPVQLFRTAHPFLGKISWLDGRHDAIALVRDYLRGFPGLVEMLPDPVLRPDERYYEFDFWPQGGVRPLKTVLDAALGVRSVLPPPDDRFHQVIGIGEETTVGIRKGERDFAYLISRDGDGTVPRDLAEIDGLPHYYALGSHSGMILSDGVADGIAEILQDGSTTLFGAVDRLRFATDPAEEATLAAPTDAQLIAALAARPQPRSDRIDDILDDFLATAGGPRDPNRTADPVRGVRSVSSSRSRPRLRPQVRPVIEDGGIGETEVEGYPLSMLLRATRVWQEKRPDQATSYERSQTSKTPVSETPDRKAAYARRKIKQLTSIAEGSDGADVLPERLSAIVEASRSDPGEAARRLTDERVLLEAEEFLSVYFLKRAPIVAKSVGRIVVRNSERGFGTGFLIAPGVLITNQHVLRDADIAGQAAIEFDHELNYRNRRMPCERYWLEPNRLFYASEDLDFAIVAVEEFGRESKKSIDCYGYLPFDATQGKIGAEMPVNIIQHPEAGLKQVVFRASKLFTLASEIGVGHSGGPADVAAHYTGDTKRGSSGSPVFNDAWEVVAIHHSAVARIDGEGRFQLQGGDFKDPALIGRDDEVAWIANEGIRVSRIVHHLEKQLEAGVFNGDGRALVERVLTVGRTAGEKGHFVRRLPDCVIETIVDGVEDVGGGQAPQKELVQSEASGVGLQLKPAAGTVQVTVPLTISLTIGGLDGGA